jgi:hypothetical protein
MDWSVQDLGALGEFVGAIIVFASVVYLAIQLRQSNRHAEASTELAFIQGLNEIWNRWTEERTTDVLQRGFVDFNRLKDAEKATFHMQVGSLVNHCLTAKHLHERGLLPEETANTAEDLMVMVLSTKGGLDYWTVDANATPDGAEALDLVKNPTRPVPRWNELFPWWSTDPK